MILVDSSVWIDHLRRPDERLMRLIQDGQVWCHPYVVGELAMGSVKHRSELFERLADLPLVELAENTEVLQLVEREVLYGKGIGFIDAHLLASTLLTPGALLWSRDRRLADAAQKLGVGHAPEYLN